MTHALEERQTGLGDEEWTDRLWNELGREPVEYQVKKSGPKRGGVRLYESAFEDFVTSLPTESSHASAWYLLTETLLDKAKPPLRETHRLKEALFEADLFGLFPPAIRPKDRCLIVGGVGARSFLHADPYEWTGVSLVGLC